MYFLCKLTYSCAPRVSTYAPKFSEPSMIFLRRQEQFIYYWDRLYIYLISVTSPVKKYLPYFCKTSYTENLYPERLAEILKYPNYNIWLNVYRFLSKHSWSAFNFFKVYINIYYFFEHMVRFVKSVRTFQIEIEYLIIYVKDVNMSIKNYYLLFIQVCSRFTLALVTHNTPLCTRLSALSFFLPAKTTMLRQGYGFWWWRR